MMPDPQPLTPVEQYVYTNGACQVFLAAAGRVVGGRATTLTATDPRQLAQHDWPSDEPLDLHIYLTLEDGRVLDAEGVREQAELERGFGVRRGYRRQVHSDCDPHRLGQPDPALVDALARRLQDLGWGPGAVPSFEGVLQGKKTLAVLDADAREWWPRWQSNGTLPPGAQTQLQELWPLIDFPVGRDLALGENPMHAWAHLPDMIAVKLKKNPAHRERISQMLTQQRYCDGNTPLHLMAERLMGEGVGPIFPEGVIFLIDQLNAIGKVDSLMCKDTNGLSAARALDAGLEKSCLKYSAPMRDLVLAMAEQSNLEASTARTLDTKRTLRL